MSTREDEPFVRGGKLLSIEEFRKRKRRIWFSLIVLVGTVVGIVAAIDPESIWLWLQALAVVVLIVLPAFLRNLTRSYSQYVDMWNRLNPP
jgi:uncharacterized membrane protein YkvA (DUF1232 family)